uniref:Reverse transcriptase domain-containing protein n=1 Tax=Plectus sambesii TaxID=2011161 RepID=A0A914WFQ1_9BILA
MTLNQCGSVKNCGTTNTIHATRLLLEKRQPLHVAFLDLEKAFDRVPHLLLYREPKSRVQAAASTSKDFRVSVGIHQGLALSPLLFILVMDIVTWDLHQQPPWMLLYADAVMLAATNKADLQNQVQAWSDWIAQFSLRLNVKKTKTVIRPVATYGAECWPMTKDAERQLGVMETKMLRLISGITRLDHVQNDNIRERCRVAPIAEKLRKSRLQWYGHVLRANDKTVAKMDFALEVSGARPRGRPKQRWTNTLHNDLKVIGLHPDKAPDQDLWQQRARRAGPATLWEKC